MMQAELIWGKPEEKQDNPVTEPAMPAHLGATLGPDLDLVLENTKPTTQKSQSKEQKECKRSESDGEDDYYVIT